VSVYLVTGPRAYRGYQPGETFEALLPPQVEERAIRFGAVEIVERSVPGIRPGSWALPRGWPTTKEEE